MLEFINLLVIQTVMCVKSGKGRLNKFSFHMTYMILKLTLIVLEFEGYALF